MDCISKLFILLVFALNSNFLKCQNTDLNYVDSVSLEVKIKHNKLYAVFSNNTDNIVKIYTPRYINEQFIFIDIIDSFGSNFSIISPLFNFDYEKTIKKRRNYAIILPGCKRKVHLKFRYFKVYESEQNNKYCLSLGYFFPHSNQFNDDELMKIIEKRNLWTGSLNSNTILVDEAVLFELFKQKHL
jgi:hypothetical protein